MIDETKRNEAVRLFRSGLTLQEIADKRGVTHQAIRSLIQRSGVSSTEGGIQLRAAIKRRKNQEESDRRCIEKYGTTFVVMREFRQLGIVRKFLMQKKNAAGRGIGWELTLTQWWDAWQQSGRWNERGRGRLLYCMARKGDAGPYAVGNIYFCTVAQNTKDGQEFRKCKAAIDAARVRV